MIPLDFHVVIELFTWDQSGALDVRDSDETF